jgi:hypothetical protein
MKIILAILSIIWIIALLLERALERFELEFSVLKSGLYGPNKGDK